MDLGQELTEPRPASDVALLQAPTGGNGVGSAIDGGRRLSELDLEETSSAQSRFALLRDELRWPALTYVSTRLVLLVLAVACDLVFGPIIPKTSLAHEIGNWDGFWYIRVATLGYPHVAVSAQTTLGFFPLYPMVMWLVSHLLHCSYVIGGLVVSLVGGLVATVLVQRITTSWWGPETAKKAVLLFCLFPGSVVFSMDYSEGMLIPLIIGCMLALERRRWVLAGVLAGLATAIGPDALTLVVLCGVACLLQFWRYGWHDSDARRSVWAALLAPAGAIAFALFLKVWAGSALASYTAQRTGWGERTSLLAVPDMLVRVVSALVVPGHLALLNWNDVIGLAGTAWLVVGLGWMWRNRVTIPIEVWAFVAAMTFLMVTSTHVPPNPRMLITAFPVVLIAARVLRGRAWDRLIWATGASFVVLSVMTYVASILRP
jgi:hypothetical protein